MNHLLAGLTVTASTVVANAAATAANGAGAAGTAAAATGGDTYLLWAVVLLAVGLLLLAIELFVPSGGLIGLVAGTAFIGSVVAFFVYDRTWGLAAAGVYAVVIPMIVVAGFRFWLHSPIGKSMVLGGAQDSDMDSETAASTSEGARQARVSELASLVGIEGVAETALRPVGTVRIDGRRIDALAEGGIIDANTPIVVVAAHDNQLKVRPRA